MKLRAWSWPVLLALLTGCGLLAALLGDGPWDAMSWALLAVVLAVLLRHSLRRDRT